MVLPPPNILLKNSFNHQVKTITSLRKNRQLQTNIQTASKKIIRKHTTYHIYITPDQNTVRGNILLIPLMATRNIVPVHTPS